MCRKARKEVLPPHFTSVGNNVRYKCVQRRPRLPRRRARGARERKEGRKAPRSFQHLSFLPSVPKPVSLSFLSCFLRRNSPLVGPRIFPARRPAGQPQKLRSPPAAPCKQVAKSSFLPLPFADRYSVSCINYDPVASSDPVNSLVYTDCIVEHHNLKLSSSVHHSNIPHLPSSITAFLVHLTHPHQV